MSTTLILILSHLVFLLIGWRLKAVDNPGYQSKAPAKSHDPGPVAEDELNQERLDFL